MQSKFPQLQYYKNLNLECWLLVRKENLRAQRKTFKITNQQQTQPTPGHISRR